MDIYRYAWDYDSKNIKTYPFKFDKYLFSDFSKKFFLNWTRSKSSAIDNHIGGIYQVLTMGIPKQNIEIAIGFYNTRTDKLFDSYKNSILDFTSDVIDGH
jgi:hypothetical protein